MAANKQAVSITLHGVPLSIEYVERGKYVPATNDSPAEEPEITILKITANDSWVDLQNLLENYTEQIFELLKQEI